MNTATDFEQWERELSPRWWNRALAAIERLAAAIPQPYDPPWGE